MVSFALRKRLSKSKLEPDWSKGLSEVLAKTLRKGTQIIIYINWASESVRKSHTLIPNKSEAWRGLNFFCDCCTTLANMCVCVHHIMVGLASLCSSGTPAPQNVKFLFFVALEGWCTRRQAVCVRILSTAAAAVLYSVCKYVNISTTSEFVLMAFINM